MRLRTAQASAVRSIASLNAEGKEQSIRFESQDAGAASYWDNDHRIRTQAEALKNALTLDILLDIQKTEPEATRQLPSPSKSNTSKTNKQTSNP